MGVCNCSMFCCTLLYVHSTIAIILMGKSRLLCLVCLPGVSWRLSGSSSWCHGVVCCLWLWYFLIILTYYFCVLGHSRDKSVIYEKAKLACLFLYAAAKIESEICSNKHETGLVLLKQIFSISLGIIAQTSETIYKINNSYNSTFTNMCLNFSASLRPNEN